MRARRILESCLYVDDLDAAETHAILLDAAGKPLTKAETTVENSGIILGVPFAREKELELAFPLDKAETAKQFTVDIERLGAVALGKPLSADELWPMLFAIALFLLTAIANFAFRVAKKRMPI